MPSSTTGDRRRTRLAATRLYLVCDSKPGGRELPDVLVAAIAGGVDIVQLRDKHLSDEELTPVASAARALCERLGALFIVNDRPAVAVEAGADGVHVGQDDMPVARVREMVGPEMLIGLSTHAPAEIDATVRAERATAEGERAEQTMAGGERAEQATAGSERAMARAPRANPVENNSIEVDYIGVGPVHSTPTKPGRPAVGLELVRYAATHARVPFFAIGSIDAGNVTAVLDAGAHRVAVVRAIADAADPERAARALRSALEGAERRPRAPTLSL